MTCSDLTTCQVQSNYSDNISLYITAFSFLMYLITNQITLTSMFPIFPLKVASDFDETFF